MKILGIESSCDDTCAAVVEDGRVGELGTHEELLALGGTYARYCEMQFGPTGWPVAAQGRGE